MAKDLPYFKFFSSEWNDGDITLEDYSVQGLFINVCSYYWSKECKLSKRNLFKRFKHDEVLLSILLKEGFIKDKNGTISIEFLDEQIKERGKISGVKSEAGKRSAQVKKLRAEIHELMTTYSLEFGVDLTQLQQEFNTSSTDVDFLLQQKSTIKKRKEKKREEKRKEDKIINSKEILNIEVDTSNVDDFRPRIKKDLEEALKKEEINNSKFTNECKVHGQWLETMAMSNKVSFDVIKLFLDQFDEHLIKFEEQKRTLKEYKGHFSNWLPKQDLSQFRTKPAGRSNQVNYN